MIPNHSPWIQQLKRNRPVFPLQHSLSTDIAVVGGGIAGVVTAYFLLRNTDRKIILLEADKIAHGATGHNAGQVASYFERSLSSLVAEFGLKLAIEGQRSIESAWTLLDEILTEADLRTELHRFTGYAGCATREQLLLHLQDNAYRLEGGLAPENIFIANELGIVDSLPERYKNLHSIIPQSDLLSLLETKNTDYIALIAHQKGCMNSALFTEELAGHLMTKYSKRFSIFEGSPVKQITLKRHQALLTVGEHQVQTGKIVLCTNGFENFSIQNDGGPDINTQFHHLVNGRIGYMAGYIEPLDHPPVAISYFTRNHIGSSDPTGTPYFYFTRRPHEVKSKKSHNLVCAGGPEKVLPNQALYSREETCSESMRLVISEFLQSHYRNYPEGETDYAFCWHGLMGYTPNGVRRIGPEPCNPILLYNLGCNGVGILPSIYGGKRISEWLEGKQLTQSIFDPGDQRCGIEPSLDLKS